MDIEQITKLIDAGYTKADIDKMQSEDQGGEKTGEQSGNKGSEDAGKQNSPEENKPENEKKVTDFDATIKALTETVTGLTETVKAMQAANLAGAKTGGNGDKTINDVMKSFIDTL